MKSMRGLLLVVVLNVPLAACGGGSGNDTPSNGGTPQTGEVFEDFLDTANLDGLASNADWGVGEASMLRTAPATSRTAYAYSYPETDSGLNSGLGEYAEFTDPLTGADLTVTPPAPPVAQGRRVQWTFGDDVLGEAGTITAVAWGPVENTTVAASYPDVRLRMGYTAGGTTVLGASMSGNYAGATTLVYEGPYQVQANSNVGNTVGQPETMHEPGYAQGLGCTGAAGAPGGHNAGLFAYTGWYPWPTLTTPFDWDPGDPLVLGDSTLLFDASVQAGDATNRIRGWFALTYPCSGLLIPGWPKRRFRSTYEDDAAWPDDDTAAGIVNPEPSVADMSFTLTTLVSIGQSLFFESPFGPDTKYGTPTVLPGLPTSNAMVDVAFQGAEAVGPDRFTIDTSRPHTGWVTTAQACDGMRYIRFRFRMSPDPVSNVAARVDSIRIPMSDGNP